MPAFLNWRRVTLALVLIWVFVLVASCGLPHVTTDGTGPDVHDIYVVKYGWHAGIVLPTAAIPEDALPPFPGIPETPYIEVGWGEARYYPSKDPGTCTLARAGLWPTASVLYVVPLRNPPPVAYGGREQVRLRVSDAELRAMAASIRQSVEVDDRGSAIFAADGHAPDSRFFRSTYSYHAFNNCNHWAAAILQSAGCDTWPRYTLTVDRVMNQARECAEG
ncbi:MAG: DUF2459 domain-containing protein [Bacteroidetes bacterium]|jgi:uncharacterized protein (TIGR02117 family)|nr:DUF2459 domain-containing protein [Bacteroidota bacterium]